jgi:transposase
VRYKFTDNFSSKEADKWLNQGEKKFSPSINLERFYERVFFRTLEIVMNNKEGSHRIF